MARRKVQIRQGLTKTQRAFQQERQREKIKAIWGYTLIAVLAVFLVLMLGGWYTPSFLSYFGLGSLMHQPAGVYADCSLPQNQNNRICQHWKGDRSRSWRRLNPGHRGPAFSLQTERPEGGQR